MQIPSSLASIVSYWFPNFGDTEKKPQGGKTPDLCSLSLDQVLQIYKQQDICPVGAEGHDSSPQFIRELEQTSWQQKQLTSGIFNHIDSMATNIHRISGRLDKLEPETQIACVVFLTLVLSINIFIFKQFKNLENEIAGLKNKHGKLEGKHAKLQKGHFELKKGHIKLKKGHAKLKSDQIKLKMNQADGNIESTQSIKNLLNSSREKGERIDHINFRIQGLQNDLATYKEMQSKSIEKLSQDFSNRNSIEKFESELTVLQEKTSKLTSEFGDFKTTKFFEITGLEKDIKDLKSNHSEEFDRIYMRLEKAGVPITSLALSPVGSRDGSWGGSQSSGSPK